MKIFITFEINKQMLVEELQHIRSNLIQNENRLAQLHADIYKRREEARKIRLSMPTPESLDHVRLTDDMMDRLQQKKKKTLCSISKLQEHTRKDLEKYTQHSSSKIQYYLKFFLFLTVLSVAGFYVARHVNVFAPEDRSTSCH